MPIYNLSFRQRPESRELKRMPLLPHQDAPPFRLLDQQAVSVSMASLLGKNGLHLLFLMSTWLPGDRALLKRYQSDFPRLQAEGMGVAAISHFEWEKLNRLATCIDLPFPLLFDPCCYVAKQYGMLLIPKFVTARRIVIISPEGKILPAS